MKEQKAQTIPVYIKGKMIHFYKILKKQSEQTGTSISEYMRRGMECATMEQLCSLQITPGAYYAMQDGRFDVLTRIHLGDGTALISVTEDAYQPKDGTPGYGDKVRQFLNESADE